MKPRTSPPLLRAAARRLRLRPVALSLICAGAAPAMAQVLPTGFSLVGGSVAMSQNGGVMNLTQSTQRGIVNWTTFSIGAGGAVNIQQPNAASILLNRVTGNETSTIAGQLNANGRVFLINPNGVMFNGTAQVNVGGLVASTLALATSDKSFMEGATNLVFERDNANGATVRNLGTIQASGGPVVLMGADVGNAGSITADGQAIALASGRRITLDLAGDGLTSIAINTDSMATNAAVSNSGVLQADGGRVVMVGQSTTVGELVVNQSGIVRARSIGLRNGEIVLGAGVGNEVRVGGTLDATGSAAAGGRIDVAAGRVRVEGATLDASGDTGGGTVQVKALTGLAVAPDATLRADGRAGNAAGGTIRIEAADPASLPGGAPGTASLGLHLSGTLSANGSGSGAGGLVATGASAVAVGSDLSVSAAGGAGGGANGRWELRSDKQMVVSNDAPAYDPGSYINAAGTAASPVNAGAVGAALGRNTDVRLQSNGDNAEGGRERYGVFFAAGSQVVKDQGGDAALRVDSATGIGMGPGSAIQSKAGALHVDFNADAYGTVPGGGDAPLADGSSIGAPIRLDGATIETNGGNVRFYGQSDAANGRAIGYAPRFGTPVAGVEIVNSRISTCAPGAASCAGGGSISLRGQGQTQVASAFFSASAGVLLGSAELVTGSGAIGIDGVGGLMARGVEVGLSDNDGTPGPRSRIASTGGDITLRGSSRGWTAGTDPVGTFDYNQAGGGVAVRDSDIATGGNVAIEGRGANLDALLNDASFRTLAASATINASHGVLIDGAAVSAGTGRSLAVRGTMGSAGMVLDSLGVPEPPPAGIDARLTPAAVWVRASGEGEGLRAAGGQVIVDGADGDVLLQRGSQSNALLNAANGSGAGGSVRVTGRNIYSGSFSDDSGTLADASGSAGGGSVRLEATVRTADGTGGMLAMENSLSIRADNSSAAGNGGSIVLLAGNSLRAHGNLSARAGAGGGNGGFVETSGSALDLRGIRVDTSASAGQAGSWLIDPFNISIVSGTASGSLPANPFVPLADSVIQDGDINAALNGGANVKITTGTGGPGNGSISLANDVLVDYDGASGARTFELASGGGIFGGGSDTVIRSSGAGALNVVFDAGVNPDGTPSGNSGFITYNGSIDTHGGSVTMTARGTGSPTSGSINMNGAQVQTDGGAVTLSAGQPGAPTGYVTLVDTRIDTRVGQSDAGAGGNLQIAAGNVRLAGVQLSASTGSIDIRGSSADWTSGVVVTDGRTTSALSTTSGNITVQGVARRQASATFAGAHGVLVNGGSTITSGSGDIVLRGYNFNTDSNPADTGVRLENGARIATTGGGDIEITGASQNGGAGVSMQAGGGVSAPGALPSVQGSGNVVLRAVNNGSTDAIVIGAPVSAANTLDLRPGGMDANFAAFDATTAPIVLGGAGGGGFSVSAAEFARLSAPAIVAGSSTHAGDITVAGPLATPGALTLQNDAGGNIALNGAVSASALGLLSAGNIAQSAAGAISASTLLARSTGGSVDLGNAVNDVAVVGGGAAGSFRYVDANAVTIGTPAAVGFDAAGNQPAVASVGSMAANAVFVRTLAGDLTLATNINAASTELVAASRFQNAGTFAIGGGNWRIWADTWLGETRGGLAGTGTLPNLYHCAYFGLCTVTVPADGNHFIYAQQPVARIVIADASRRQWMPNPLFLYSINGLILGDGPGGFSGMLSTTALPGSPPGSYPINGSFASAAGYAIEVVPGTLRVDFGMLERPSVDVVREQPSTWLYDRNIGQAPICLATGALEGDRAAQDGDLLAREWTRVRSRPNLLSCVNTERRNGCSDF
ncbi:filamentous hemagglutinin family protein [Variovorax sp. TBS-050B]|uniref:two-partner secretion domain-containing protein n=1 Tax=Variovorax sp. TBS-050B TaxID=2940551 RepID=UPI002473DB94|nr:filamentous hemagglutinin N-terminal domain-containing protein [Variovorax sp. TBS-050B]MDH6592537.1 filamentous hemagglutinin family protein [Variovorax sp. TBS-050B]